MLGGVPENTGKAQTHAGVLIEKKPLHDITRNHSSRIPIIPQISHTCVPRITEPTYLKEEHEHQKLVGRTGHDEGPCVYRSCTKLRRTAAGRNQAHDAHTSHNRAPDAKLTGLVGRTGTDTMLDDRSAAQTASPSWP